MASSSITVLTRYTRRAASSRVRHFEFLGRLAAEGYDLSVQSFFQDSHLDQIYGAPADTSVVLDYARSYWKRFRFIAGLKPGSVAWIEKEIFPRTPFFLDALALGRFRRSVLDLDDAWFLRYERDDHSRHSRLSRLFDRIDIATVPNEFLADAVRERGARDVRLVGPAIDTAKFAPGSRGGGDLPTIGWIGMPINASRYLAPLVPVLNELIRTRRANVVLVGAGPALPELAVERRPWSEATEANDVRSFDIGIMPLDDTLWSRCKSGYKLLQTMACGRVAVGSAVGYNRVLIEDGVDGILVEDKGSDAQKASRWHEVLSSLVENESLRIQIGASARKTATLRYGVEQRAEDVANLFGQIT